jgi:arginine:ornithine antiporter/lysine permease
VLITATMSAVVPAFGAGDTVLAVVVSAIGVWLFASLVMCGVKDAAVINYIVTIAKVVPILMFIVIAAIAFKADVFTDNFWGDADGYSLSAIWDQATGTMLITMFVFLGIEGASVDSRMARKREDVGRATVIGFLSVLSVFALVTMVSYGVMLQDQLAGVSQPSMAAVLESIVGHWGSIFIRVGVIVSVLGAYLAWTLMSAEVLYIPAKFEDMPRFLARTNSHGAPVAALSWRPGSSRCSSSHCCSPRTHWISCSI